MALFNLVKCWRGNKEVVMTDERVKVLAKQKMLATSQRKGIKRMKVVYVIKPADEGAEKFMKPPHDMYLGGSRRVHPRVPRK